jgi:hypothetical protein
LPFFRVQPTFFADTVFMNTLQNEVLGKLVTSYRVNLSLAQVNWVEIKNATAELLSTNNAYTNPYNEETIVNQ